MASSIANDIIMRMGAASAVRAKHANDVIIAGMCRYGNWRRVAMGCIDLVTYMILSYQYTINE